MIVIQSLGQGHSLFSLSRRPGCSMPEIWDVEDPENAGRTPLCTHMNRNTRPHFTTVFANNIYKVLKVPRTSRGQQR